MRRSIAHTLIVASISAFAGVASAEMIRIETGRPVKEAMDRLEAGVKDKGFKVFARIDHAAGAQSVNQQLRPTELLIFGNPAGGTPIMQAEQTMGLSLPLRVLIWQDSAGKTQIGYDAMAAVAAERGLKDHPGIGRMTGVLKGLTEAAAQ